MREFEQRGQAVPPEGATVGDPSPAAGRAAGDLAYLLAEFPSLSETFILREMLDLVDREWPLRIYALRRPPVDRPHADAKRLLGRVFYRARPGSPASLRAHLRAVRRNPVAYSRLLLRLLGEGVRAPRHLRHRVVAFDAAIAFASALRAQRTRHIHAHFCSVPATAARYAAGLLGISYSFSAHARDIYVDGAQDRVGLVANLQEAAFVVTCTEYNRRYLVEQFPEMPPGKVHRIYHGVDLERFHPGRPERKGPTQILAVGRLVRKKGLHILVEACGELKRRGRDFVLIVAGDGPERGRLTALAAQQGLDEQVLFTGQVTQEQLLPVYGAADILALPCLIEEGGDRDGLPNVILEALACGLAVVSTPISGIPEVVEDGVTGLLAPPEDVGALADALERLLTDPDLRRRLGDAGRERVRRSFDIRESPLAALFAREVGRIAPESAQGQTEEARTPRVPPEGTCP